MKYSDIYGIVGLIVIILLYILMKRSQKNHPEKYKMISVRQGILYAALAIVACIPAGFILKDILESTWEIMAPI